MDKALFDSMIRDIYQNRKPDGIKSDFGKVLIIGGSKPYPLSVCIADKFASLSGVGYVSLAVDKSIYQIVASRVSLTSIFEISTRDEGIDLSNDTLMKYDSILFGNGISINPIHFDLLKKVLSCGVRNIILDASALSMIAQEPGLLFQKHPDTHALLTPHLGEAKRILHTDISSRNPEDYLSEAILFALKYHVSLLLKSTSSLLIDEEGNSYSGNQERTPSLGKAGTGDGFAGLLSGLLAYADSLYSRNDIILFSDYLLHQGALLQEKKHSAGTCDILTCFDEIKEILEEKRERKN